MLSENRTVWQGRPGHRQGCGRGFTLVEILCVLVIMGIAAAIVVPQISSHDDLKAAAAARVVIADLIYAQNQAITRQAPEYVIFDMSRHEYRLASSISPESDLPDPITGGAYVVGFGPSGTGATRSMDLASAQFDSQTILAFDSLGAPQSVAGDGTTAPLAAPGQVTMSCGANQVVISIQPITGEISSQ